MEHLIHKYLNKLEMQGLARREKTVFLALDAERVSNRAEDDEVRTLSSIFDLMNINSLLFAEPDEPYKSIIAELIRGFEPSLAAGRKIVPMDCETRTFFHDIPVVNDFSPEEIARALSRRKSVLVRDRGIVTYGVVTPEQAFVSFSSTCFSTFVKYFYDSLLYLWECAGAAKEPNESFLINFKRILGHIEGISAPTAGLSLTDTPPEDGDGIVRMLAEAGRAVVECRLVDSFFGNISYVHENTIYISQTGSSMDELECCIDAVPLDGSSSVGITASSELSAHKNIYQETGHTAILHGHPKFPVIMSMYCLKEGCDRSLCHKTCREKRYLSGVPVVSGEIGTGPTGLMHTVPEAMREGKGAIVYGHGVFTAGDGSFREPFSRLLEIDTACRKEYLSLIDSLLGRRGILR
ncbi:MAG: class II aldolase/adducin family protein [Alphaproteobacteria bacterium]|uniref:Class II aldolase/adducin family protein n=1 Tax=Candidatus Nitrobium versatile TaxID=2884831 RepID=A0A953LXN5_9BACT|nr:class II aldolase/adducin family protein [Candidatus Nitrobium versatile]